MSERSRSTSGMRAVPARAAAVANARPRGRRATLAIAIVIVFVIVAASSVRVLSASATLREARDDLVAASAAIADGDLARADDLLADAEQGLEDVTSTLHTAPDVTALGLVPGISQNLTVLRRSLNLASVLVHGGRLILGAAEPLQSDDGTLELSIEQARVDVDTIDALRREVDALLVQLTVTIRDEESGLLFGDVRELATSVTENAERYLRDLDRARRGMVIADELLGISEPSRTLIVVANTAEMRGAGGMMLNYGVLDGRDGGAEILDFARVEELAVGSGLSPEDAELPEDFTSRWDGFAVTQEWRNATLSADFRSMAPVLAQMYEAASGVPADNVLQVDPHALAGMLSVTGPIQVPEVGAVDASNVVDLVLNEAYRRFPDVEQRTDVLGEVAEGTFRALVEGDISSARSLAQALSTAVDGRHLLMWSDQGSSEAALEYYQADGSLPAPTAGDYLHLTAQNMSGNKLDYYVDTSMEVTGTRTEGDVGTLDVRVRIVNNAPPGETQPQYIFGPFDDTQQAGVYRSAITLYLPTGATLVDATSEDGFRLDPAGQTEFGRPVVGYWIDLPAGEEHVTDIRLRMPPPVDGDYSLTLVPSPRVRPTSVSVDVDLGDEGRAVADVVLDAQYGVSASGAVSEAGY